MFINRKNRLPEFVLFRSTEAGDEFYVEARMVAGGKVLPYWTEDRAKASKYSSAYAAKQVRKREALLDCVPAII